jgi:hypothetical protein
VQRRHNCSPAASFANCFMTLYLLKVHLQTFLSIPITQKCQMLSCDILVPNKQYVCVCVCVCVSIYIYIYIYIYILMNETDFSETSIYIVQTTWCHILRDGKLHMSFRFKLYTTFTRHLPLRPHVYIAYECRRLVWYRIVYDH